MPRPLVTDRDARFSGWIASLEERHLQDLTFPEVSRALRALSATYVERRAKLAEGAALATRGKRAAFALFYGPLHHLLIAHIVRNLPGATSGSRALLDLGCGTGAAGAAWAAAFHTSPRIVGIDRNAWALSEAAATYRAFGIDARTERADLEKGVGKRPPFPHPISVLAAFTINELADSARDAALSALVERVAHGDRVLIVEPIAGGVARWWSDWRREFERAGGRADEWRVRAELPAIVAKLDRAAGLDHRELTGRSLWIPGR